MTDRQLGFTLPPPPVLAGGVVLLLFLFKGRAKAEFLTPTEVAAKVEASVKGGVKKLERTKKKAREDLDKKLVRVEKDTKERVERRERRRGRSRADAKKKAEEEAKPVVEARAALKANKPKKSTINKAKENPLFKAAYDQVVRQVKKARESIADKAKKQVRQAERAGEKKINELTKDFPKELRGAAGDLYRSVKAGKIDVPATKKLGERYAKKAMTDIAKDLGADKVIKSIPNIPSDVPVGGIASFVLKGDFSSKAVAKTGQKLISDAGSKVLSDATGFPIDLPDEFTAKAFKDSLLGLVPTDIEDLVNLGVTVAAQAAASALTAVLAGTAIGSVIPGLGTIVGLGVGLAIVALKGPIHDIFGDDPRPIDVKCPTKVVCPRIPKKSPIELIPWAAKEYASVMATVAADRKKKFCGKGSGPECETRLNTLLRAAYYAIFPIPEKTIQGTRGLIAPTAAKNTIDVLGKYEVETLLKLYGDAPKTAKYFDTQKKKVVDVQIQEVTEILNRLKRRKSEIEKLLSDSAGIETMVGALPDIRFRIVSEVKNATVQVYFNESSDTKKWLEELAVVLRRILAREKSINAGILDRMKQDEQREAELQKQGKTGVVTGII